MLSKAMAWVVESWKSRQSMMGSEAMREGVVILGGDHAKHTRIQFRQLLSVIDERIYTVRLIQVVPGRHNAHAVKNNRQPNNNEERETP
jgi:hypothetical protein